MDDVRDVPAAYITTNQFTQNGLKRYMSEEKNEVQKRCRFGDQKTFRGLFQIYGGKRCVLSLLQKVETVEQERRSGGNLFHSMGAAKEKERLPSSVRIKGTVSRLASEERRLFEGLYGERSSDTYIDCYGIEEIRLRLISVL